MKLSDFLDKHQESWDKMRILKKMLKTAEANKSKTVSVKKARSIIFNHTPGGEYEDLELRAWAPRRPDKKAHGPQAASHKLD